MRRGAILVAIAVGCGILVGCSQIGVEATRPITQAQSASRDPNDVFLDGLVGRWDMVGELGGHPVHYLGEGVRTLGDAWLEFHMVDAAVPRHYEARVFIAVDTKAHDFVSHWLDQFGGAGARVTAAGTRIGSSLTIEFPYAEGAFRNVWTRLDDGSWALTIDSQSPNGAWSEFARYALRRR